MKKIILQQDANEKIIISVDETTVLFHLKKHFKWRKDISILRFKKLGTSQHDKFIKHLSQYL